MPDVTDDMDDLFKKAAEHYPLNTNSGDWNEVHQALPTIHLPISDNNKKKKPRRLLWLLLLLPLIALLFTFIFNFPHQPAHRSKPVADNFEAGTSIPKNHVQNPVRLNNPESTLQNKNNTPTLPPENSASTFKELRTTTLRPRALHKRTTSATPAFKNPAADFKVGEKKDADQKALSSNVAIAGANNKSKGDKQEDIRNASPDRSEVNTFEKNNTEDLEKEESKNEEKAISPGEVQMKITESKPVSDDSRVKPLPATKTKKTKTRNQHFYAGIIGGLDVSTVKLQKFNKAGVNVGILAGYKINKRWSIESGFYLDKKYYYTTGKYFNPKNIYVPPYTRIINLSGNCYMLEVPVNVKYDFKSKKGGNWFALLGNSSYIMKKEAYRYLYKNNYGQEWEKKASYRNSSKNWGSILNVSAGYSRHVGKTGIFRIEPYLKIPLKRVGIGALPITSSGVYFGFTKNLF